MYSISNDNSHLKLLNTYLFADKIRLGNKYDGGYVVANINNYDCYISVGIGNDESFSNDLIKTFKPQNSFAFDNTISSLPYNYPNEMTYVAKNIGINNTEITTNLEYIFEKYNDIFIKMDIEGFEYEYILSINPTNMKKIKQIVFELHGINDNGFVGRNTYYIPVGDDKNTFEQKKNFFKKMNETHYLVHVHYNSGGDITIVNDNGIDKKIPNVLEVAYIRKDLLDNPQLNTQSFPIKDLDYQNYEHCPELCELTYPPFCFTSLDS
jgi:hypothetical protein